MNRNLIGYAVLGAFLAPGVAVMGCNGSVGIGSDSSGGASGAFVEGSAGGPVNQAGGGQVTENGGNAPTGETGGTAPTSGAASVYENGGSPPTGGAPTVYENGGSAPTSGAASVYENGGSAPTSGAPSVGVTGGAANNAGAGNGGGSLSPRCSVPAGQVETPTTTQTIYEALVGRWLICWGGVSTFDGAPSEIIGIEFSAPTTSGTILRGNAYYLVNDSVGAVVRGAGFDYQLTYDVSPQDPAQGSPVQLNLHPTPNTTSATQFRYSASPRQWQLTADSAHFNTKALLVVAD